MRERLDLLFGIILVIACTLCNANTLPFITEHPRQNLLLTAGDTVKIAVTVGGDGPFSYQWVSDTGAVMGATDSILVLGPVGKNDNGTTIYCEVSNSYGTISSRSANLIVKRPTSQLIVVSGELRSKSSSSISGEAFDMDFIVRLYSSLTSDSSLYKESFLHSDGKGITVDGNRFFLRLGEGETDNDLREVIQSNTSLYVSFSVSRPGGNFETLSPRTPLTASPYAFSGTPEVLRGGVDPRHAGLEAPVGTYYIDNSNGKTYIRTHNSWAELE
ncbi:immunoglobulin domain-containing protein [Chitinispirillales bacterium ANBcel5]|uniref:immunoglobulin domain-containing protein n=1 Tax=Cellulosispirillum alkaliphilum TaxID=3039283 RepID=UPI002A5623DE|nr:immunoglobulin domain-containing protein [Chitinispirillales bacterium ANBcel5]